MKNHSLSVSQEIRDKRIMDLQQDMSDLQERIRFKEKRIEERLNIKDCDEIKEEVMALRKQPRGAEKPYSRSLSYHCRRQSSESDDPKSKSSTPGPSGSELALTLSPKSQQSLFSPFSFSPSSSPGIDPDGDANIPIDDSAQTSAYLLFH